VRLWVIADLKEDREVLLAAVSKDGVALQRAGEGLRADHELVLGATGNRVQRDRQ